MIFFFDDFRICLGHVKDGNDNFCNVKKIQLNELAELDLVNPSNDQFLIQFTSAYTRLAFLKNMLNIL